MHFNNSPELEIIETLRRAITLIDKNKGPITGLYKNPRYNDEPLLFQYTTTIKITSDVIGRKETSEDLAGGMSFSKEKAVLKALGEGIERYCLALPDKNKLIYASVEQVKDSGMDLSTIVSFSKKQLLKKDFGWFSFNKHKQLSWVKGYSLTQMQKLLIPAQLVYVPFHPRNESLIRFPISTGAAAGTALLETILRGIYEVVERDAFVIFYLNKLTPPLLDLSSSRNVFFFNIFKAFKRYKLELFVFNITTDLSINSIMAIIVDRTGIGPAISVGLKASYDIQSAIIGAIEEAQHVRSWIRDEMLKNTSDLDNKPDFDQDIIKRGLLWSKVNMIKQLNFFLESKKIINVDELISLKSIESRILLKNLLKEFNSKGLEVLFVDITTPEIRKIGFYIVKVIIPRLQPLYLNEEFKYLGGARLYKIPEILGYKNTPLREQELNQIPHPFL